MTQNDSPPAVDTAALAVADEHAERMRRAAEASDHAALAEAARDGWYELLTLRSTKVCEILEELPGTTLRDYPVLLMMLGLVYNATMLKRARALRYFGAAVAAARQEGERQLPPLDRALIRIGEAAALRLLGRPSRGVEPARKAVTALDELTIAERASTRNLSRLYSQAGIALYYGGRTTEAIGAFTKGVAEAPDSAPVEGFSSMAMLAGIHARNGQLGEASMLVERMRHEPSFARERDFYSGTFYRIAEATLALERFDAATARAHISRAAPNRRAVEHWLAIAETEALVSLIESNAADGLATLEAAVDLRGAEGRSARSRQQLARIRVLLHLALGDLDAAHAIAHRDPRDNASTHIERARVALAMGQPGTALKELRVIAGSQLSPRSAAEAAALEMAVLTRYPPRPRLKALATSLAALLTRSGLRLPLVLLPAEHLHRVLSELSRSGAGGLADEIPRSVLLDAPSGIMLTTRERVVLAELPRCASTRELATQLGVSPNTVKTQLRGLYRKLGAANREDAIAIAIHRHLLVQVPVSSDLDRR